MKKILLGLLLLTVLLTGCQDDSINKDKLTSLSASQIQNIDPEFIINMEENGEFSDMKAIAMNEAVERIEKMEDGVYAVTANDCIFCLYLKPVLNELAKENKDTPVYVVDIKDLSYYDIPEDKSFPKEMEKDLEDLDKLLYVDNEIEFQGTPHIFRIEDGELTYNVLGYHTYKDLYKELGFAKN